MSINEYDYYCPKCQHQLSNEKTVLFHVKRSNSEQAKLYLNPKPGSYDFSCDPAISFSTNELVDFYCPGCNQSLNSSKYDKFVEIALKITDMVYLEVFFSRIYGIHKTYVGIEDFEKEYGEEIRNF